MESKKKFIMLVGLPYSGKSYLIKTLGFEGVVVSSDQIILDYAQATGKSYNDVFKEFVDEAQRKATEEAIKAFKENKDVCIDQTNLTKASRRRKLALVPKDYEKVCIVVMSPTPVELEKRMNERQTHRIPLSVLENMQKVYQKPMLDEGFDVIYYAGFDDIVVTKES